MHKRTLKYTVLPSSVLALAGMGDAFLYVYLPANYQNLGLPVFWLGIFLSVNRFTRLVLYSQVAHYLSRFGLKNVTIAALVIAACTTLSYGFITSIYLWLLMRVLWGISFSALRLSSTVFALKHRRQGISLGLSKSITEIGSALALVIGPVLILHFDRRITFVLFAILSLLGIFGAWFFPPVREKPISKQDLRLSSPSALNILVLLNTFVAEGMLVVLAGRLLLNEGHISPSNALLMAGLYLAYRRLCLIVFSPLSGWFADIWGFRALFNYTNLLLLGGFALIAFGYTIPGLVLSFTFSAMNSSVAPGGALTSGNSILKDISDNATWRDMGAALGTLTGSVLLNISYLHMVFQVLLIPMIAVLIVQLNNSRKKAICHGIS